jgi:hypothetical protein
MREKSEKSKISSDPLDNYQSNWSDSFPLDRDVLMGDCISDEWEIEDFERSFR